MKKLLLTSASFLMAAMLAIPAQTASAQEVSVDAGMTLTSRFIYRGIELGNSPNVQAMIGVNTGAFSFYGWGSHSLGQDDGAYKEVKFWANYTLDLGDFTLTPQIENHFDAFSDLFDLDENTSTHVFQASARLAGKGDAAPDLFIGYAFGPPVEVTVYVEAGYSFTSGDYGLRAFLSSQYSDGPGFVDLGYNDKFVVNQIGVSASRTLRITDSFSVPLGISLVVNPRTERIFTAASISF
ncbi:MAG: hypothetical protein JJU41_05505 [Bacteroidetes bacterium]|nr:hypothetical protein [Bacteroidota bacterium]